MTNEYGRFCRPGLVPLFQAIGLDVTYERAKGDYLWHRRGHKLIPVLDLVGGYGANLFGHNHPDLVAAARALLDAEVPVLAQASCRGGAARLAEELCRRLGDYVVTFTNSGTETVEAAVKHCLLERPRKVFWALKGAFHGKTLGAIQFTWLYRDPYQNCGPSVHFLDPNAPATWEEELKRVNEVGAVFIEPIAGEGGVRPVPPAFISWITKVCRENDIPLVVDEIQTGMGRTGTFLAAEALGIKPDYICLSKALGGGLAKIGALLVRRERYVEEFSVKHTSTFAEDDFSSGIALEALRILDRDGLPARCKKAGDFLIGELRKLQRRFPEQIKDVRGAGLMVGLELYDYRHGGSYALRMLSKQQHLGYLVASYLLNAHQIRIAPTLSEPLTLRLEPSAYVKTQDLERFVEAATWLCRALRAEDLGHLTRFRIGSPAGSIVDYSRVPRLYRDEPPRTLRRVAFLGHLLSDEYVTTCEPSLEGFGTQELEDYLDKSMRIISPTIFDRVNVRSRTGEEVHLSFIGMGLSSRQILHAMRNRDTQWIMRRIEEAVRLARDESCSVIGFGGYTSIVTANCLRVRTRGIALTSGNSLTVGMGLRAIQEATRENGIQLSGVRLAVIGATGNIASTYAIMMAPKVAELVLVIRDLASPKLAGLLKTIRQATPNASVRVTESIEEISDCSVIITASNTPEPLIYSRYLAGGPVVICDISLPSDVADEVKRDRPDVLVIQGGVVKLPHNEDLEIGGIPLRKGHVFSCMAETMLLGLEGVQTDDSIGSVKPGNVLKVLSMAEKHGFSLADINADLPSNTAMSLAHTELLKRRNRCVDSKKGPRRSAAVHSGSASKQSRARTPSLLRK
jgi:acetylornithine/succinyldiaminopimelate/putrescine aminotransferase/predicted amino acid dehydrogenase